MTEEKKKTTAKKAPAKKAASSGKTVTVTQTGSSIGRKGYQAATLKGLGLGRIGPVSYTHLTLPTICSV